MKTLIHALLLTTALGVWAAGPDFDDPGTLNKILREGLAVENIQERDKDGVILIYAGDSRRPYTGWIKSMGDLDQWKDKTGKPGGQIASLFHCEDGLLHGPWTQWHSKNSRTFWNARTKTYEHRSGEKQSQTWKLDKAVLGEYQSGEKEGLWTEWGWEGNGSEQRKRKASEGRYQNGRKEGPWSELVMSTHSNSSIRNDLQVGSINGELAGKGLYRNGEKQGPWIIVPARRGEPQEVLYKDGAPNGLVTLWGNGRNLSYYKNGKIDGIRTEGNGNGKTVEVVHKSGKMLLARYGLGLDEILGKRLRIPAVFHGLWVPGPGTSWDHYYFISSNGIGGHEQAFDPLTVEIIDQGRVMRFTGIGYGEATIQSTHDEFRLSPDGKTLTSRSWTFRRRRTSFY